MFSVKVSPMIAGCSQLEEYTIASNQLLWDLEDAVKELKILSGLEAEAIKLKQQKSVLEEQELQLHQMLVGLDRALFCYTHCENHIIDHVDESMIR